MRKAARRQRAAMPDPQSQGQARVGTCPAANVKKTCSLGRLFQSAQERSSESGLAVGVVICERESF